MSKVILTTKVIPTYDDLPGERYHFPHTYLNQVQQAVGDFAIYYEPRRSSGEASSRGGRQAYFLLHPALAAPDQHMELRQDSCRKPAIFRHLRDQPLQTAPQLVFVNWCLRTIIRAQRRRIADLQIDRQ